MSIFGPIALIAAIGIAGWLLWRVAHGQEMEDAETRNVTILKGVVWLVLAAALFAAKLFPLALMTLIAAGGVTAIEIWRSRTIRQSETAATPSVQTKTVMDLEEARSVLGIAEGASRSEIKSAHRTLISQLHPDKGGTDYLASKINEARDLLIKAAPAEVLVEEPSSPGEDDGKSSPRGDRPRPPTA
ncbi:MAG: DnaJ domain-containing protein [Pseudomonadota bacterium]